MSRRDTLAHLFAGGCGGTVGAILTCPLEVVKTRLQSSSITLYISAVQLSTVNGGAMTPVATPGPLNCLKMMLEKEGPRSLFRGLGPNLVGVAPSRAIYFAAYSTTKERMNSMLEPDSIQVHTVSAGMAGKSLCSNLSPVISHIYTPSTDLSSNGSLLFSDVVALLHLLYTRVRKNNEDVEDLEEE